MNAQQMPTVAYFNRSSTGYAGDPVNWQQTLQKQNVIQAMLQTDEDPRWLRKPIEIQTQMATRRIVQVIIADTNDNVPLEACVLYKGTEKLTDATDQELFFETNISDVLAKHNTNRVKWLDKEATKRSGRDVFLEPAKIRELKMVVVTVAQL